MEIEFLGTGTSTGVPQIGCDCDVCRSGDARDTRLRTSAIVRTGDANLLLDCGPDFRTQMLRASDTRIDSLLVTHSHYDHVGGIDDLRPYCSKGPFPVYAQKNVIEDIKTRLPYCFLDKLYPGVPTFDMVETDFKKTIMIGGVEVRPLPIWHYKLLINGYRIGENLAYITDAKGIDAEVTESLKGVRTLVINALRIAPHMSHFSLSECLAEIEKIKPEKAYLIHVSHDMGKHAEVDIKLPKNVHLAYDGLRVKI